MLRSAPRLNFVAGVAVSPRVGDPHELRCVVVHSPVPDVPDLVERDSDVVQDGDEPA